MFETKRLRLRGYRPSDEEFFFSLYNEYPVLYNLTEGPISPDPAKHRARLDAMIRCLLFVVIEEKETSESTGFVLLSPCSVSLSCWVSKRWRRDNVFKSTYPEQLAGHFDPADTGCADLQRLHRPLLLLRLPSSRRAPLSSRHMLSRSSRTLARLARSSSNMATNSRPAARTTTWFSGICVPST